MRATAAATAYGSLSSASMVWVHVYHIDPVTAFLNRRGLKAWGLGIYHAAVEIHGEEWCFQYFIDTWDDPSYSGVIRCRPKRMPGYDYQESVCLGHTSLSKDEVEKIIHEMRLEWPACSYHLTHRNCLSFARTLAQRLRVPEPFPGWVSAVVDLSNRLRTADYVVDTIWECIKSYQRWQTSEAETSPKKSQLMARVGRVWTLVSLWITTVFRCLRTLALRPLLGSSAASGSATTGGGSNQ
eukprot:gnl/TRDRNA2_/TRDRNA2_41519_c0_seq1.p1 gnl/TRDRNA2_/TRDRNA2_41519_c0~~gnl/TRDRNA2_/TRDRNA2_41519_c0_seq1.p1  ORF type:complete len:272 (+),score=19.01 gnl/TRDRNA2_/TRDRNA2_41519_c0_seq1:98-817(+)